MKKVYLYNEDDEYLTTIRVPDETKYISFFADPNANYVELYSKKPKAELFTLNTDGVIGHLRINRFLSDTEYCRKRNIYQYALKIEDN